jgi:glycosyltransferase involved in cell wall biosynthesis
MCNETSLVSIIIPTFNSEKFILETIQSVQNQTYENWEVILVDDCSDNTVAIILEMVEKMIGYFSA